MPSLVRITGLEPALTRNRILNPACLPFHHIRVFHGIFYHISLALSRYYFDGLLTKYTIFCKHFVRIFMERKSEKLLTMEIGCVIIMLQFLSRYRDAGKIEQKKESREPHFCDPYAILRDVCNLAEQARFFCCKGKCYEAKNANYG